MPGTNTTIAVLLVVAAAALIFLFRRKIMAQITPKADRAYPQRFARLLISEIKLYNQQQVESARKAGNIYQELKPEIDRARKTYDESVSSDASNGRDYFYEELVNVLAGGDATKLGSG